MEKELISVIAPVYNVEQYIGKFIKSVQKQTYRDFELILVTDSPTDRSADICEEYACIDPRIIVIHNSFNMGVSKTRNNGLRVAGGDYIMFADSDDFLEEDALQYSKNLLDEKCADIAVCGMNIISRGGVKQVKYKGYKSFYTKKEALDTYLNCHTLSGYSAAKLYKKRILENLTFPEDMCCGEDGVFSLRAYNKAERGVPFSPKPIYNYLVREGSLSGHGEEFSDRDIDIFKQIRYARECIVDSSYKRELNVFEFLSYNGILSKYLKSSDNVKIKYAEQALLLRKSCDRCWKDCFVYGINPLHKVKALQYRIDRIIHR